jgi:hypothetical protein
LYPQYILHAYSIIKLKILYVQFESISMDPSLLPRGEVIGRNDRIGTQQARAERASAKAVALTNKQRIELLESRCANEQATDERASAKAVAL